MGLRLDGEEFDALVADALDLIPAELAGAMSNVVVLVEDEPPADAPELLGVYHGIPLTERDSGYTFREPDRIVIFKGPLLRMCESAAELVDEVAVTVVHEVAHHFGIEDGQLHAWGYG